MSRSTVAFALALSMLSGAALAQAADKPSTASNEAREKYRAACAPDIQKFCANIEKAKGATRTCLESNAAQLSDACKVARTERAATRAK